MFLAAESHVYTNIYTKGTNALTCLVKKWSFCHI